MVGEEILEGFIKEVICELSFKGGFRVFRIEKFNFLVGFSRRRDGIVNGVFGGLEF